MEPSRYPIGPFEPVERPTAEQRSRLIAAVANFASTLRLVVDGLSTDQLQTCYRPGGWTVQQVVHHLADNDLNAYFRFKRALTEECPSIPSYREDRMAELPDYREPIDDSLLLLQTLHSRFAALLRALHTADFQRTLSTSALGTITLDTALQRFVWHDRHHSAQIAALKERSGW